MESKYLIIIGYVFIFLTLNIIFESYNNLILIKEETEIIDSQFKLIRYELKKQLHQEISQN